jgi:hypothetical protein
MNVPPGRAFFWEAESGLVLPGMAVGEDEDASGRRYVGQSPSLLGQPSGRVTWSLAIEKSDRYWLWARVRSINNLHGVFSFQVTGEEGTVIPAALWKPRSSGQWHWQPLDFDQRQSTALGSSNAMELSKGVYHIQLQTRQSGAMIDRLMLSPHPKESP